MGTKGEKHGEAPDEVEDPGPQARGRGGRTEAMANEGRRDVVAEDEARRQQRTRHLVVQAHRGAEARGHGSLGSRGGRQLLFQSRGGRWASKPSSLPAQGGGPRAGGRKKSHLASNQVRQGHRVVALSPFVHGA